MRPFRLCHTRSQRSRTLQCTRRAAQGLVGAYMCPECSETERWRCIACGHAWQLARIPGSVRSKQGPVLGVSFTQVQGLGARAGRRNQLLQEYVTSDGLGLKASYHNGL